MVPSWQKARALSEKRGDSLAERIGLSREKDGSLPGER
jgi:hypothetical protein